MNIPKKIKIGGFEYAVERTEQSFVSEGTALDGVHNFAEKKIVVAENGCEEYQEMVFMHEICHGIIAHYLPGLDSEEEFVEQFSKGLYQVVVDNPCVFVVSADVFERISELEDKIKRLTEALECSESEADMLANLNDRM